MKFRFTIGRKIGTGFGILIILTLIAFLLTQNTLNNSREINDKINQVYAPSVGALEELNILLVRSKMLISNWVYIQSSEDNLDKTKLRELWSKEYPELRKRIQRLSSYWEKQDQNAAATIFSLIEKLYKNHKHVISQLNSFESYEDPNIVFIVRPMVQEGDIDVQTKLILSQLSTLIEIQHKNASRISREMIISFDLLQRVVKGLGWILVIGGIIIAAFTVRSIVKPVKELRYVLLKMGKGILPDKNIKARQDEIGEMSIALNGLIKGLKSTAEFAKEVGSGNFDSFYKPLSEKDMLGGALLKMRTNLAENEQMLETKVNERTEEVVKQKEEIENKNQILEVLYKQVTDSIRYAKRIQEAILPPDNWVKKVLPNSFTLYKPKDIVSGDFYWVEQKNEKILFAAVDCTGHGVPGAFMSIVGYNILKHVINNINITQPSKILDTLNLGVSETLHKSHDESSPRDGMDIALCTIDFGKKKLQYAGAYNPLYLIREGKLIEYKADKFPIGHISDEPKLYTNTIIDIKQGDCLYIFSDGYADQFGGPKGKKFMVAPFRQLLLDIHRLDINEQKNVLNKTIEEWKENEEQVDDILVMGLKIE